MGFNKYMGLAWLTALGMLSTGLGAGGYHEQKAGNTNG
jgi:hypothetical protein